MASSNKAKVDKVKLLRLEPVSSSAPVASSSKAPYPPLPQGSESKSSFTMRLKENKIKLTPGDTVEAILDFADMVNAAWDEIEEEDQMEEDAHLARMEADKEAKATRLASVDRTTRLTSGSIQRQHVRQLTSRFCTTCPECRGHPTHHPHQSSSSSSSSSSGQQNSEDRDGRGEAPIRQKLPGECKMQ